MMNNIRCSAIVVTEYWTTLESVNSASLNKRYLYPSSIDVIKLGVFV